MASNDYHFITHWRVRGTVAEVRSILSDPNDLPRWWPSFYREVHELAPGDERGVGREIDLFARALLPYTLRWQMTLTETRPDGFTLTSYGELDGRGIWTFEQDGEWVDAFYDWKVTATKPMMRYLSFLLRPVFAANHNWVMNRGEESLRVELARQHAATDAERDAVPPPPGPAHLFGRGPALAGVAVAATAGLLLVAGRAKRRRSASS